MEMRRARIMVAGYCMAVSDCWTAFTRAFRYESCCKQAHTNIQTKIWELHNTHDGAWVLRASAAFVHQAMLCLCRLQTLGLLWNAA